MSEERPPDPRGVQTEEILEVEIDSLPATEDMIKTVPDYTGTRNTIAVVLSVGMTLMVLAVIAGGMLGSFDDSLVGGACTAYSAAFVSAAYFYFKKAGGGSH